MVKYSNLSTPTHPRLLKLLSTTSWSSYMAQKEQRMENLSPEAMRQKAKFKVWSKNVALPKKKKDHYVSILLGDSGCPFNSFSVSVIGILNDLGENPTHLYSLLVDNIVQVPMVI